MPGPRAVGKHESSAIRGVFRAWPAPRRLSPRSNRWTGGQPGGQPDQPQVAAIVRQCLAEATYFVQALERVKEGETTLLDHSLVLAMTDCSNGKSHAIDEYPLFLAGGAGGTLARGLHVRALGENASKLGFSILRMFDAPVATFGSDEGKVSSGLDEIEA